MVLMWGGKWHMIAYYYFFVKHCDIDIMWAKWPYVLFTPAPSAEPPLQTRRFQLFFSNREAAVGDLIAFNISESLR